MIIKKFQGKTKEEALEAAYRELGNNVVEMNVRNVKRKGLFGFLMPQMVEVTVALEEESIRQGSNEIVEAIAGVRSVAEKAMMIENREESKNSSIDYEKEGVAYTPSSIPATVVKPKIDNAYTAPKKEETREVKKEAPVTALERLSIQKTENSVIEEKLDSLHNMLEAQLQKPEEEASNEENKEAKVSEEVSRFVKLLYNTMIDNEIDEIYANQIIEEMEKSVNQNTPFELALSNIYQKMILKFGNSKTITPSQRGSKVVFFVGPTGVGKTTTMAKIACIFSVGSSKKVAMLTADTYRIAAEEQLHTYANILEVPFRTIRAKEDMEKALTDLKGYDYIFVDTAGHSHHNLEQRDVMNEFIHSVDGLADKEVFLVLSATTKYKDLISIADTYREITDFKLIFTKLDETTSLGNLLNIKLYTGAPLSYVTCGQNVPEDIEEFNAQKTVKQLLGGRKN